MPDVTRTLRFDPRQQGYEDYGDDPRYADPRYAPAPAGRPRMTRSAIAGTIGAVVISIGLVLALVSTVFTGNKTATSKPNLPGVIEEGGAPPTAAAPTAAPAPTDEASEEPTATPAPTATPPAAGGNAAAENQVIALVNSERAKRGDCDPVSADDSLTRAARTHSADMANGGFLNHKGSDGSSPDDRMRAAGYDDPLSENVARGFRSAKDVMNGWMDSKTQRNHILDCDARSIGVGVAVAEDGTAFWTQNFGG
jgi:uncharacterized protein YkwD